MSAKESPYQRKRTLEPLDRDPVDVPNGGQVTSDGAVEGQNTVPSRPTGGVGPKPPLPSIKEPPSTPRQFEEEKMTVTGTTTEGMHTFGIGKAGISRAVVCFTKPPKSEPLTVMFHFPNTFLSHAYVLHCVRDVFKEVPEAGLVSLSFVDRNVRHGCTGLENRWLLRCRNVETKEALLSRGLALCNKRVTLRNYDDVISEEYVDYMQYRSHRTKLYGNCHEQLRRLGGNATGPVSWLQGGDNITNNAPTEPHK